MSEELSFTGERLIPGKVDADLFNEHFVRYRYAQDYSVAKNVLDTGCGVGYGSCHLAELAHTVVGVDNDPETIQYACRHYSRANVQYVVGDCQELPFRSESFDVITSFELIEHLPDTKRYLTEIRRILRTGGMFIVSTPNRSVYGEHRGGEANPFHVREWDFDEFVALLKEHFAFVEVLGQSHIPTVGILNPAKAAKVSAAVEAGPAPAKADYFVCICSQQSQHVGQMVFASSAGNVLLERERYIKLISSELRERNEYLTRLQAEFDEKALWAGRLNAEVDRLNTEVDRLNTEVTTLRGQLQDKVQELGVLYTKRTRWKRALFLLAVAPLDLIVGCTVLGTELVSRLIRRMRPINAPLVAPADTSSCSIILPSWQGKDLLAESLPALLKAVQFHGGDHEVIVVDNGSTDGTREYVKESFPEVRIVRSDRNLFFSGGSNLGVQSAVNGIVVLLNNDMVVCEDFLEPLLRGFSDAEVFAVGSQVFLADPNKRREETGKTRARFNGHDLDWAHDPILPSDEERKYVPVFWGHGGAVALDRQKYLWLGGLDTKFDPFYVEDADLSYRAWKVGWSCLLAVGSHVVHKHRGTIAPHFSTRFIAQIIRRNQYLFIWKNFGDLGKLLRHFLRSPGRQVSRAGIPGRGIKLEVKAFLGAWQRLPAILKLKLRFAPAIVHSDEEVLQFIETPPSETIQDNEVDFRHHQCSDQLGEGWYGYEVGDKGGYRWIDVKATAFLRSSTSNGSLFTVEGYVPALSLYGRTRLQLRVQIGQESHVFDLEEGEFVHSWFLEHLQPGSIQKVELSVDRSFQQTTDKRRLGMIIFRFGFTPSFSESSKKTLPPTQPASNPGLVGPNKGRRSKRILFITAFVPAPNFHAGGQRVFRVIKGLSRFHEITLLTFLEEEKERERLAAVSPYCQDVVSMVRPRSFRELDPWGIKPRWLEVEYNSSDMRELVKEAALGGRFDLLQFEFLQMSQFLPENSPTPTLLTHHEIQVLALERKLRRLSGLSAKRFKLSRLWMQMLRYELTRLKQFTRVIVLTDEDNKYLRKFDPSLPIVVNPTGVDCAFFQSFSAPEEPNSIAFVGYFGHEPNVDAADWLIKAIMPKVARRFPDARLYLVGNEPSAQMKEHRNGFNVSVTGWVPDIRPYLGRCAVFVAPLRLGAGIRGKVQEAWAMKRAVVCTSVACAGIHAQDEKNLLLADDEDSFADQICRLLGDAALRERLGQQGLETACAYYDWEKTIEQHKAIYDRLLQ